MRSGDLISSGTTALCYALLAIQISLFTAAAHDVPTATIDSGRIVGIRSSLLPTAAASVDQFLGIPFAQSPPKRFGLPEKPQTWRKPLKAIERKPSCIQQINYPAAARNFSQMLFNNPSPPESEDCLYLNVWAPSSPAPAEGRAVLFWIYGGSFRLGNGGQPYYDGSQFAAYEDVIVVTHNYRINVFGFPSSPEIPLKQRNLGLHDQRFALDWVQRNIHAFGGNPSKVTIFGESAGGTSVDALVTSFDRKTAPFRGAIQQSGQNSFAIAPPSNGSLAWESLVAGLNCTSEPSPLECVRCAPALKIKDFEERNRLAFAPYIDGVTVISQPAAARKARKIAPVPILIGSNANDASVFTNSISNLTSLLDTYFPGTTTLQNAIAALYPLGLKFPTVRDQINQVLTDYGFQCSAARLANDAVAVGIPAWRYYYNASFPNLEFPGFNLGAYHSSEIAIIFSTYSFANATRAQIKLSNYMRAAWARFAKYPSEGPGWAGVGAHDRDVQVLGSGRLAHVKTVKQVELDSRCAVYYAVYDAVNAASLVPVLPAPR